MSAHELSSVRLDPFVYLVGIYSLFVAMTFLTFCGSLERILLVESPLTVVLSHLYRADAMNGCASVESPLLLFVVFQTWVVARLSLDIQSMCGCTAPEKMFRYVFIPAICISIISPVVMVTGI